MKEAIKRYVRSYLTGLVFFYGIYGAVVLLWKAFGSKIKFRSEDRKNFVELMVMGMEMTLIAPITNVKYLIRKLQKKEIEAV